MGPSVPETPFPKMISYGPWGCLHPLWRLRQWQVKVYRYPGIPVSKIWSSLWSLLLTGGWNLFEIMGVTEQTQEFEDRKLKRIGALPHNFDKISPDNLDNQGMNEPGLGILDFGYSIFVASWFRLWFASHWAMAWNVSWTVGADDPLCEAGFCVWEVAIGWWSCG